LQSFGADPRDHVAGAPCCVDTGATASTGRRQWKHQQVGALLSPFDMGGVSAAW
jgi:hypothetical protein